MRRLRRSASLVIALGLVGALAGPASASASASAPAGGTAGSYVVIYKAGATPRATVSALATTAKLRYHAALNGFAARLDAAELAAVRRDPAVARVVPDIRITLESEVPSPVTQLQPPWGLDRIDQRNLPLNNAYTAPGDGTAVTVYVLDTGLRTTHTQLTGRVGTGINYAPHAEDPGDEDPGDEDPGDDPGDEAARGRSPRERSAAIDPADTSDCNGHGTHVAGTIGGTTYGVAKAVTIVPVRVLDCEGSGSLSGVIAGVDWVTAQHSGPSVVNMSLGATSGSATVPLEEAIGASIAHGVTYAVAAGNESSDACDSSPADVEQAITVAASTSSDHAADYSNFGSCVDLYAPGSGITSSWYTSDTATAVLNGTSMATPHVAGVAALVLQATPTATPAQVRSTLIASAASGVLSDTVPAAGDPNVLLQVPASTGGGADTTAPTLTGVTGTVSGSTVTVRASAGDGQASEGGPAPSGAKGYTYVWTRSTAPVTTTVIGSLNGVLVSRLVDSTWYVHVRAVDVAGNYSSVATAGPFRVDVNPPRVTRIRVGALTRNRFWAQLSGVDTGTGLSGFTVAWNHSRTAVTGAGGFAGTSGTVTVRSPKLTPGVWYLHLRARDRAGHWSGWLTVGPLRSK